MPEDQISKDMRDHYTAQAARHEREFVGHVSGPSTGPITLTYPESYRLMSGDWRNDPAFLLWCKTHAEGLTGSVGSALCLILTEELRDDLRVATAFRGGRAYQAQHPDETDDYPGEAEG